MRRVILIAHNIRSTHNIGSMLRTAEGLGVGKVYLTGYTPYPLSKHDDRLPHVGRKLDAQIHKTALGAEQMVPWEYSPDIGPVVRRLRETGYHIAALEQDPRSVKSTSFHAPDKLALIVGREVKGIEKELLDQCDTIIEIPMTGRKESFNVAIATAIMLYQLLSTNT